MNSFTQLIRYTLLVVAALGCSQIFAAEPSYIEQATIILNITEKSDSGVTGAALASACDGCQPMRLEINAETRFYLNGAPTSVDKLGTKIDWQGSVFYLPGSLPVATELFLN